MVDFEKDWKTIKYNCIFYNAVLLWKGGLLLYSKKKYEEWHFYNQIISTCIEIVNW